MLSFYGARDTAQGIVRARCGSLNVIGPSIRSQGVAVLRGVAFFVGVGKVLLEEVCPLPVAF